MKTLTVLIPKPNTLAAGVIDVGSGIVTDPAWDTLPTLVSEDWRVGSQVDRPDILVYYEGNRYGCANLCQFEERVLCAAGRLDKRYPTIAKGLFPRKDFIEVGTFRFSDDWRQHELDVTNAGPLQVWLRVAGD